MSFIDPIRRGTAPVFAQIIRKLIQSGAVPGTVKTRLWRFAEYYVSFYGVIGEVRTRVNTKMSVNTSKMVEKQIYYWGEWEPFLSRYLQDAPKRPGIFLDLGANIGYFTLLAASRFDQVIAVEASPSIAKRLSGNVLSNGFQNVDIRNVAVGEEAGEADFFFDEGQSGGSSLLPGNGRVREATVPVRPLAEILTPEEVGQLAFIKVDVEGYEHIALQQILDQIDHLPHKIEIVLEYAPERNQNLWGIIEAFLPHGFRAQWMQGTYDISEYSDLAARPTLDALSSAPDEFCDIILRRG